MTKINEKSYVVLNIYIYVAVSGETFCIELHYKYYTHDKTERIL